ncbi:TOM1-like protein 9 [Impatiens glandulifera]|uniref:TOM1-like protein 9 n=1 Tax=Impatiens glandulifera TaxID=253017 RepID=UPI001FB18B67|nr:TOM1-like protein 9 [Impatiens glandulifera]
MVNSLVDRATSDMLKGPDFAKIREICNICIRDAVQAKEAIKGVKKRLQSRSPKVQLLSLILLDTLVKNCGDVVHRNVIEKDLLIDMIKIMNKKPDYRVKEKILILIETWQETLGGARAKRPQFYAAFLDLLHAGVTFPRRSEKPTPKLTPPPQPQASPATSLQIVSDEDQPKATAKEDASPSPSSSTEIQNAQGIMGVLEDMLNALEPKSKEVLCKDVIVDLVKNCPAYKQRVAQLVNSTCDELLLQQGLALNDNLQIVSTKHEAIVSETPILVPPVETPKPKSNSTVVKADAPLIDTEDSKHSDRSVSKADQSPIVSNGQPSSPIKKDPEMDLLSFDDLSTVKNSLAIVPAGTPPVANSQNGNGYLDMFSQVHDYPNGHVPNGMMSQYDPSLYNPYFNGQITRSASHVYGNHTMTNNWFPQSPWEFAKSTNNDQPLGSQYYNPTPQVTQVVITNSNSLSNHPGSPQQVIVTQHSNPTGLYSPQMQMGGHMGNFGYGSGYQNRMPSLSFSDDSNSVYTSTPSIKSSMTHNESFGDLTDLSKLNPGKM